MKIYHNPSDFKGVSNPIITTGTFDGVHLGHQKIIKRLSRIAKNVDGETVLMTFHPHPRMVLFPDDHNLELLSPIDEKIQLLENFGLDNLLLIPFTKEFSRLTPTAYVRDLLVNQLDVHTMVIGYDHRFGRNREGDFSQLIELSNLYEFEVEEISAEDVDNVNVSSTKVRKALKEGEIEKANSYLGHVYFITGKVIGGDQIGRRIGFPTANLKVDDETKLIPKNGAYAVEVRINNAYFKGMMNIGIRPTVSFSNNKSIEINLFDFDDDIYGQEIKVYVVKKLRDEKKFENLSQLENQLLQDKKLAYEILS